MRRLKATAFDRELEAGAVLRRAALELRQERPVDLLNVDAAVLHGLDGVGELQELEGGGFPSGGSDAVRSLGSD